MQQKNAILYTTLFAPEDSIEFSKNNYWFNNVAEIS